MTYSTDGLSFQEFATTQRVFDASTGTAGPLQADLPPCFWQADLIVGGADAVIERFDPPRITYGAQGRLLSSRLGGQACPPPSGNRPPTVDDQTTTTSEDVATTVTLTGSDPDEDPLTFGLARQPLHGVVSGVAPQVTYMPDAGFHGTDSFTFKASDGRAMSRPPP